MAELGKIQELKVIRTTSVGVYLNTGEQTDEPDILLPRQQVPETVAQGDSIRVFVYRDSEDRMIATTREPGITLGQIALLEVLDTNRIGAFLDWGLDKDLLLPFAEQTGRVSKGDKCLVMLYQDSSDRLCATMNIYQRLATGGTYKLNDRVKGMVYSVSPAVGAFVAVDGQFQAMIPKRNLFSMMKPGDQVEARVSRILPDGKLELSTRAEAHEEIETDAVRIMERIRFCGGVLMLNDASSPEAIRAELNMSKAAFKRAVGRLMKEGAVRQTEKGIELNWKK